MSPKNLPYVTFTLLSISCREFNAICIYCMKQERMKGDCVQERAGYRRDANCNLYFICEKCFMLDKFPSSIQFWVLAFAAVVSHCNISHPCPFDYPPFSSTHNNVCICCSANFFMRRSSGCNSWCN